MVPLIKRLFKIGKTIFIVTAIYMMVIAGFMLFAHTKEYAFDTASFEKQTFDPLYAYYNDPKNSKTKEQRAFNDLYKLFVCKSVGQLCGSHPNYVSDKDFSNSILGGVSHLISTTYTNPPASGVYWAYSGLQHIGIVPKTYAAEGIGMAGIQPLSKIWLLFRNATYLLLTLLIVTIGLLIMFRFKINPQTVVTLENSLPRIIITLILITFSFAIAGFMIDLMYMVILMAISVFASIDKQHFDAAQMNRQYVTAGFSSLWEGFFPSGKQAAWNLPGQFVDLANLGAALMDSLPAVINGTVRVVGTAAITWGAIKFLTSDNEGIGRHLIKALDNIQILSFSPGGAPAPLVYYILVGLITAVLIPFTLTFGAGWILAIIIFFTLVALFFRIIVLLFATYLRIILYVIFAPFMILTTAIPGRNGFVSWIRSLAGELSVFPTVIILLMVGRLLVTAFSAYNIKTGYDFSNGGSMWTPPFLWGLGARSLAIIIAMQMIFLIPELTRLTKSKISGKQGLPFRTGAGIFFGGVTGPAGGAMGSVGTVTGLRTMLYGPGAGLLGQGGANAAAMKGIRGRVAQFITNAPIIGSGGQKPKA